jgi:methionyl-tRNA formyltransferase
MTICVAGKNQIAIDAVNTLLNMGIAKDSIVTCLNKNDTGINNWQPSFKFFCERLNLKILSLNEIYKIENLCFISLEFDRIIDPTKFKTKELFNIHFSLLPKYKGMYTSIFPVLYADEETGVTLHKIDRGIDTGDIIYQESFKIREKSSFEVYKEYLKLGTKIFDKEIKRILTSHYFQKKQDVQGSTYNSKSSLNFSETEIPFKKTAFEIERWVKAFSFRPFQMATFRKIPISHVFCTEKKSNLPPGQILEETDFYIKISTIDYEICLCKDLIADILFSAKISDLNYLNEIFQLGYNINDYGENGWTPLMVASYNGNEKIVKWLLKKGADINAVNFNGTSVLMYAMTNASQTGNTAILEYLLNENCNFFQRDYRGKNVLEYALEHSNSKVISILQEKNKHVTIS